MPISAIDGCTASHWEEVRSILTDAITRIKSAEFAVKLVSEVCGSDLIARLSS